MSDRNNNNISSTRIQPDRQSKSKCKEHIEKYLEDIRLGRIVISEEEKQEDELDSDYEEEQKVNENESKSKN
jgi:hypothetical protein